MYGHDADKLYKEVSRSPGAGGDLTPRSAVTVGTSVVRNRMVVTYYIVLTAEWTTKPGSVDPIEECSQEPSR